MLLPGMVVRLQTPSPNAARDGSPRRCFWYRIHMTTAAVLDVYRAVKCQARPRRQAKLPRGPRSSDHRDTVLRCSITSAPLSNRANASEGSSA
jgi:hypothetical protein